VRKIADANEFLYSITHTAIDRAKFQDATLSWENRRYPAQLANQVYVWAIDDLMMCQRFTRQYTNFFGLNELFFRPCNGADSLSLDHLQLHGAYLITISRKYTQRAIHRAMENISGRRLIDTLWLLNGLASAKAINRNVRVTILGRRGPPKIKKKPSLI